MYNQTQYTCSSCLAFAIYNSDFKQVKKLDLQQNDLVTIPDYIFELPSLCELNLSRNKLEMLPKLTAWSISLLSLDLSHNKLSTIPGGVIAARIYSLNLSSNEFKEVPLCVCYFQTLHVLDLSNNKDIRTLPAEMGRLRRLQSLDLSGLTSLCDPPKSVTHDVNECISYLRNKLYCFKPFFCMKLVLLGMPNCGKTTLGRKLQGRECESETKVELDISEWNYKPNVFKTSFSFSVWDFVGTKEFFATYHCCLTKGSIYLVVFNVKNGRAALEEIQFWLTNLAQSMPSSCVHIVGTHLDEVPKNERDELDGLLHEISGIASKFSGRLKIEQICAVGLGNEIQLVTKLKDSIYMTASEYKVGGSLLMGQMVPASYQTLNKSFSDLIMHVKKTIIDRSEFKSLIHDLGLNDIQTDDELDQITRFLTDIGTILHYNDPSNNLAKLYFVDPPWLCKMIYSTVKSIETDTCFINGIKDVKSVSYLLHKEKFPLEYFDQYITLLDRFEIALVLEESKILIPSQLSTMQPRALSASKLYNSIPYIRYILFDYNTAPIGFWSRLIARIMQSCSKILNGKMVTEDHTNENPCASAIECNLVRHFKLSSDAHNPSTCPQYNSELGGTKLRTFYWSTGIFYEDDDVFFILQSTVHLTFLKQEGIMITAAPNDHGRIIFCFIIDLIRSLFQECYRGAIIHQLSPCSDCITNGNIYLTPFLFEIEPCLQALCNGSSAVRCIDQHTIPLSYIIPDLMLLDIKPSLVLNCSNILYTGSEISMLGGGGYAMVYSGKCINQDIAVKVFSSPINESNGNNLRKEVLLLQNINHPCVVNLLGACLCPKLSLVLERAPLGSLEVPLVKRKQPIHRVVIHRILAQVTSALECLHSIGIIHRDVKASNVLIWSLDPMSLCHCKITDFGTAIFEAPNGAAGIEGTQSFVAPEVYSFGDCQKNAAYDHNIDIFSLAMLIYQAISRRNPFDKLSDANIITAVVQGVRPKIGAPPYIEHAFLYLSKLMQHCWNSDPRKRPGTKIIIKHICQSLVQSVMLIESLPGPFMLQHACIASESSEGGIQIMVWLDHPKNPVTEAHVLSIDAKLGRKSVHYTISGLVECVCQCGNYVLVAPRVGFECGMINVFESGKREMIHSIATNRDESVCCMMCSKNKIYCGTSEGSCFSFLLDPQSIKSTSILWIKTISNYRIESIVAIQKSLWVSSSNQIHILNSETLDIIDTVAVEKRTRSFVLTKRDIKVHSTPQVARKEEAQGYIGQLKLSFDNRTIWSCHLRHSSLLSAWSAEEKRCLSGVNITPILSDVYQDDKQNVIISAMAPVLDTVWVGTTSGHILVLKGDEPLLWFRPYKYYICFLECITQPGLCQTEEAMVVSGSKGLMPYMVENFDSSEKCDTDENMTNIILWEAFPSKLCGQIKAIESESPTIWNSHDTVKQMLSRGQFSDGTNILKSAHEQN